MTFDDVKGFFGSGYQFKKKTGMDHTNYIRWEKQGYIPILTQFKLQELSGQKLIARYADGEGKKTI